MLAVILGGVLLSICSASHVAAQSPAPRYGHKAPEVKQPRALGLIQLAAKGKKARLIPVAILMDGKFFDAGSFKAAPVPMALEFGIVYEGFKAGVSEGVFTITQPGQLNHVWIAEGTWTPAGERVPEKSKKFTPPVIDEDNKDAPPVLHRRHDDDADSKDKEKDKDKGKDDKSKDSDTKNDKDQKPATTAASPTTPSPTSGTPGTTASPSSPSDAAKSPASTEPAKPAAPVAADSPPKPAASDDEPVGDPNRPRLRRGKPDLSASQEPFTTFEPTATAAGSPVAGKPDSSAKDAAAAVPPITLIPAISDAGGPDPRPYTYEVKPAEEADYRNKMLDLAAAQLRAEANAATKGAALAGQKGSVSRTAGKGGKTAKPAFDDVNLHIFDLSNSNQPVLVLSAKTHPAPVTGNGSIEEPKEITLIARTNLEGELLKLFFSQTDSQHLYSTPRMELIDAVDADGDGRGELLFRRTFDEGSAYAIYRVTADRLWPLFEGTP